MIDRIAYIAMTGAKHSMGQLATTANNMANVHTPGFREMVAAFRAVPLEGEQADSRAFVVDSTPRAMFQPGPVEATGSPMDFAIEDDGFFVVRRPDGSEVLTRGGRFFKDQNGVLRQSRDAVVVGETGDIVIPPNAEFQVAADGAVFVRDVGEVNFNQVNQIRLVNPNIYSLIRADDGYFQLPQGSAPPAADPDVRVKQGHYESSNVNTATSMVQMINQTRMFELNMKAIQIAEQNSRQANVLMTLSNV